MTHLLCRVPPFQGVCLWLNNSDQTAKYHNGKNNARLVFFQLCWFSRMYRFCIRNYEKEMQNLHRIHKRHRFNACGKGRFDNNLYIWLQWYVTFLQARIVYNKKIIIKNIFHLQLFAFRNKICFNSAVFQKRKNITTCSLNYDSCNNSLSTSGSLTF